MKTIILNGQVWVQAEVVEAQMEELRDGIAYQARGIRGYRTKIAELEANQDGLEGYLKIKEELVCVIDAKAEDLKREVAALKAVLDVKQHTIAMQALTVGGHVQELERDLKYEIARAEDAQAELDGLYSKVAKYILAEASKS